MTHLCFDTWISGFQELGNRHALTLVIWLTKHQYAVFHCQHFITRKSRHALNAVVDAGQQTRKHYLALGKCVIFKCLYLLFTYIWNLATCSWYAIKLISWTAVLVVQNSSLVWTPWDVLIICVPFESIGILKTTIWIIGGLNLQLQISTTTEITLIGTSWFTIPGSVNLQQVIASTLLYSILMGSQVK